MRADVVERGAEPPCLVADERVAESVAVVLASFVHDAPEKVSTGDGLVDFNEYMNWWGRLDEKPYTRGPKTPRPKSYRDT